MSDKAWKAFERRVAKYFGAKGRNLPQTTNENKRSCDVVTDSLVIECKLRSKWPKEPQIIKWLLGVACRAVEESRYEGVLCIQVKSQKGFWIVAQANDSSVVFYRSTLPNPYRSKS